MAEGLKKNHTLLGLHFAGNPMRVNALGFLIEAEIDSASMHLDSQIHKGMRCGHDSNQKIKLKGTSN